VDYATATLLKTQSAHVRAHWHGRIVAITTGSPLFAVHGIRPGATLAAAEASLGHGHVFTSGSTTWFLAPESGNTAVVEATNGLVTQVGIAAESLTKRRAAQQAFVKDELRPA
jgi:hypothetical protein